MSLLDNKLIIMCVSVVEFLIYLFVLFVTLVTPKKDTYELFLVKHFCNNTTIVVFGFGVFTTFVFVYLKQTKILQIMFKEKN